MAQKLNIKYESDLKQKTIELLDSVSGKTLAKKLVKNPLSTLDSPKLKKSKAGRVILNSFNRGKINSISIEYGNCINKWGPETKGVFPANLDSLNLVLFFKKNHQRYSMSRSILEMGCGQGFITQYLYNNFKNFKDFSIIDSHPNAIKCSLENLGYANHPLPNGKIKTREKKTIHYSASSFFNGVPNNKKFDLIVSNPPYIPSPSSYPSDRPYFGTEFLMEIIKNAKKYLSLRGHLVLNIGGFIEDDVLAEIKKYSGHVGLRDTRQVALSIPKVVKDKKLIKELKTKGLKEKSGTYLQKLIILDIVFDK